MEETEVLQDEAPKQVEDFQINARITFVLKDDVVIENIIIMKSAEEFANFRDRLADKKESGILIMQGSLSSPFDFFIIPWDSIIAIKFKNVTELSEAKLCCNCDRKY